MQIIDNIENELPFRIKISFKEIFSYLEEISRDEGNFLCNPAKLVLENFRDIPELRDGFEDFSYLEKYKTEIDQLLAPLFPELLQKNEIKAAGIPFNVTMFKFSKRFQTILENVGEDYKLEFRNFDQSKMYVFACTFILNYCYGYNANFSRPFFLDVPDKNTGIVKAYRILFNADFFKVKPLPDAPKITEEDYKLLIDNFDNVEIWKEKFPPGSYLFEGFGILNLFDVSLDESISNLKGSLLNKGEESLNEIEKSISNLFNSTSIQMSFSTYKEKNKKIYVKPNNMRQSFLINGNMEELDQNFFCEKVYKKLFDKKELLAISDLAEYGKRSGYSGLYSSLHEKNIQSLILVPLKLQDGEAGVLEIVSKNKYELNSINAHKLIDIIPIFEIATQRFTEELNNRMESIIQENYTTIHSSVKWRFYEEAEKFIQLEDAGKREKANLKSIVFENVIPLYGQSDIKGSSIARNRSIQSDLIYQLKLAVGIIERAQEKNKLPIYEDLIFRIRKHENSIGNELDSGEEVAITHFLQEDIYPVFKYLETKDVELEEEVKAYMDKIDPKLKVIYHKRRSFDESVNMLNEELANFIDKKQEEAQEMFPHYFERYKTDGLDYNMYIGQSLVKGEVYNPLFLYNLRLWQLQMMCEMENVAEGLKKELKYPLKVASLILVHSSPLSIKFRMDEKRFDVDGAYNIRYEIIKKRIDKAHIKNTKERLTQPGKIAIVYSQKEDAIEYFKYIGFLQSKGYILEKVEELELEELQGMSGLKALRVGVNYENYLAENLLSIEDLMKFVQKNDSF